MNDMDMDNMDNITLYFCGIYLLPNESAGGGNCLFHAVGASDVVIGESFHDSLRFNFMNKIMEMYKSDPLLLSSLYQNNRPGRMPNVDLPKYIDLQKNNDQWGTKLYMLFISILYSVQVISVQWFGDALICFDTDT